VEQTDARDSDLDAAITESLDEAAGSPQKATAKSFLDTIKDDDAHVGRIDVEKQGSCPVCDETLCPDESILRLPCAHVFHHDCLMPWLGTSFIFITSSSSPHHHHLIIII